MFTYPFDRFLQSVFSLLRAGKFYIYIAMAWRHRVFLSKILSIFPPVISAVVSIYLITSTTVPQIPFLVLRPEFGARFAPFVHDDISLQNSSLPGFWHETPFTTTSVPKLIFLFPISAHEKWGYFRFRILANH